MNLNSYKKEGLMRKTVFSAAVLSFVLLCTISGFSETSKQNVSELGLGVSTISYKEPGLMKEEGLMWGLKGSYAYHKNLMLKVEGDVAFGRVKYTQNSNGFTGDVNDWKLEMRGLIGYDFAGAVVFTPYTGIGYRHLNDGLDALRGGYERGSTYYYSPIGFAVSKQFANGWSWDTTLEYDIFWKGQQVSCLSRYGFNDVKNDQDEGCGYRASMLFQSKDV